MKSTAKHNCNIIIFETNNALVKVMDTHLCKGDENGGSKVGSAILVEFYSHLSMVMISLMHTLMRKGDDMMTTIL